MIRQEVDIKRTSKELIEKVKHCGFEEWRLAIEKIEKDLKALEIIKTKKVNMFNIWVLDDYKQYKLYYPFAEYHAAKDMLNVEEFDFLKEVLEE